MGRNAIRAISLLLMAILAFSASAQEVYKWTDDQGVIHYSDRKPAGTSAQAVQLEAAPTSTRAVQAPVQSVPDAPAATHKRPLNITMYSTADCGYCKRARRYFAAHKLPYVERDISNRQHRTEWTRLGGRAVPLFVVNGQVSHGFSADGMTQRLQRLGW
jgi:glutaredoxin